MPIVDDMPAVTTESTLSIVPAEKKEMSHVIMLAHRIWPRAYENILTPEQIANMLDKIYTHEHLQSKIDKGHRFWVAYDGITPVGYVSSAAKDDVVWVKKLYVDPDMQGRRIGVKLLHTAVSAFLPATEIRLLANPNNIPAHRFYEHLGFSKIGIVPVQMGDWHFDDFLFSMPLTDK